MLRTFFFHTHEGSHLRIDQGKASSVHLLCCIDCSFHFEGLNAYIILWIIRRNLRTSLVSHVTSSTPPTHCPCCCLPPCRRPFQLFDDLIAASLDYYGQKGVLDRSPVPLSLEREKDARLVKSPLKFPGKIATDLANGRLFISDSNNHRIVSQSLKALCRASSAAAHTVIRLANLT